VLELLVRRLQEVAMPAAATDRSLPAARSSGHPWDVFVHDEQP
jgi:hypothetical protein